MIMLYKVWAWMRDHAWLFLIVGIALLIWIVSRGKKDVKKTYTDEKTVIDAKAEARKAQIELGAEKAAEKIKTDYAEQVKKMDADQAKRAKELENDPEKLVEAILRATMVLLLFLLPLAAPAPALGADDLVSVQLADGSVKKCHKLDPNKCAMVAVAGKPVAFDGLLQTFAQAADLTAKAEFSDERIKAAADVEVKLVQLKAEKDKAIFQVRLTAETDKRLAAEKALADAGPPWYVHPAFVVPVTVAVTIGAILLGAEISKKERL